MSTIIISDSKSNSVSTIDEPLFDQSLSSNNSSNTNIRGIMKHPLTDLDKYIEDWLGRGGVHDDSSINRVFVLKLNQLGYKDFGTIYRVLYIENTHKIPDLKEYIWKKYKRNYKITWL